MLISQKIPLAATLLVLGAVITTGSAAFVIAKSTETETFNAALEATAAGRTTTVEQYLESIREGLVVQAGSDHVASAMKQFEVAYKRIENPVEELQRRYIEDNPHPTGEK